MRSGTKSREPKSRAKNGGVHPLVVLDNEEKGRTPKCDGRNRSNRRKFEARQDAEDRDNA